MPKICRLLALLLPLFCTELSAHAQDGGDFEIQSFRPALDSMGLVTLDRSDVLASRAFSFGLHTHWAARPLQLQSEDKDYALENVISPVLLGAVGLRPFGLDLQLGVALPLVVVGGDRGPDDNGNTPDNPNDDRDFRSDAQGIGNVDAQIKWRLRRKDLGKVGIAAVLGLRLPSLSASASWLGANFYTPHLRVAIDKRWGRISLAVNIGAELRKSRRFVDAGDTVDDRPQTGIRVQNGSAASAGIGLGYQVSPSTFSLVAELIGEYAPKAHEGANGSQILAYQPLEAVLGAKLYLAGRSHLSFGGGRGLLDRTPGNPDWRAYLSIVFEPKIGDSDGDGLLDDVDRCPNDPEDYDDFEDSDGCPDLDNDCDGILDIKDLCPNVPEDRDDFEDEDGCPEDEQSDRDGDRIVDKLDSCPDDPEDYDGFQDKDGCPDFDNDDDKILDIDDLCPDDPEDYDQFEDRDGCPEADNDLDRIVDSEDKCPRVDGESIEETAETYNTVDDDDGCPDRGPVTRTGGGITVLEEIQFEFNSSVIKEESFGILNAVALTILTNEDIGLIEVQGHTDERGSAKYNLWLSNERAKSVQNFLVEHGVAARRLQAHGYGESQPKIRESNPAAWRENRRVEFVILGVQ